MTDRTPWRITQHTRPTNASTADRWSSRSQWSRLCDVWPVLPSRSGDGEFAGARRGSVGAGVAVTVHGASRSTAVLPIHGQRWRALCSAGRVGAWQIPLCDLPPAAGRMSCSRTRLAVLSGSAAAGAVGHQCGVQTETTMRGDSVVCVTERPGWVIAVYAVVRWMLTGACLMCATSRCSSSMAARDAVMDGLEVGRDGVAVDRVIDAHDADTDVGNRDAVFDSGDVSGSDVGDDGYAFDARGDAPQDAGGCQIPSGCCGSDRDCRGGEYCVNGGSCSVPGDVVMGVCKSPPKSGCWSDRDCLGGMRCVGASVCPCGARCFVRDRPGRCM